MIAVDSLVHNHLHRTGILRRLGAAQPYGPSCYGSGGCADVIEGIAARIDARAYHPHYPRTFARWVQHSLWRFCAVGEIDTCNGRRIDDRGHCRQGLRCPAYRDCDRDRLGRG